MLLCEASDMKCLISRLAHDSFEHEMVELVSWPNSTVPSNMRKLWCVCSSPDIH